MATAKGEGYARAVFGDSLTPAQVVFVIALVVALAIACQVIAPRLHVPGLLLLLPAGFLLGMAVPALDVENLLGSAFGPVVDLVVAVILFQGGLELGRINGDRRDRRPVLLLVWVGASVTGIAAALMGAFLLGFPPDIAALFGAILVVSGPTVVSPLLDFVKVRPRLRAILMWEGDLLDPFGALAAVIVFQVVKASGHENVVDALGAFGGGVGVAIGAALVGLSGILDRYLGGAEYVRGDGFTMGGIPLRISSWRWFAMPLDRPDLPNLARWFEALKQRPAYRQHIMKDLA